jgi:hypothetical protein
MPVMATNTANISSQGLTRQYMIFSNLVMQAMLVLQSRIEGEAAHSACLGRGKVIGRAHVTF